ncbi:MAG: reverse gyrase [Thermoprotei archaeon]|nr:MAG: reverse gyrase [Thermoprotei archaeon]RLF01947.1 MAG: reverse gyrase [Thermoprotei archaeon]
MTERHALFKELCPNCGGEIDDTRLLLMAPCEKCLPVSNKELYSKMSSMDPLEYKKYLLKELESGGLLKNYRQVVELDERISEINLMFRKVLGSNMWSAQRTWAKRLIQGKSFAILAPTGVGKTVFGIMAALYIASRGGRSYIILPTTLLVSQVHKKLQKFSEKLGLNVKILGYSGTRGSARKDFGEALEKGEFNILITTSQFLARNYDKIKNFNFDFIFVDDVDALLKSSKNIDRVLVLLGFPEDVVNAALRLIYIKRSMAYYISRKLEIPSEILNERKELEDKIKAFLSNNNTGLLIVSTATGKVRGIRVKLFRELLGFEVGSRAEFLRNIADMYYEPREESLEDAVVKIVSKLGKGGLVFVPVDKGVEYAEYLTKILNERGIAAGLIHAREKEPLQEFLEGRLDVLVGIAIYYGLLVRGLDYPEIIRYAVFAGVPRFKFALEISEPNPIRVLQLLINIRDTLKGNDLDLAEKYIVFIRRVLTELDKAKLLRLMEALKEGETLSGSLGRIQERIIEVANFLKNLLAREDVIKEIEKLPNVSVIRENGRLYILVPDAMTYLQASGRTSRMYAGGISKGLSVVIVDDKKLINGLIRQTKWYSEDVEWQPWNEKVVEEVIEEVNRDREKIRKVLRGEIKEAGIEPLRTALLIVESPNKARTISNFFGKPTVRKIGKYPVYEVGTGDYLLNIIASGGHVYDLVTREGFHGVKVSGNYFIPIYTTLKRCLECGEQFTDEIQDRTCPNCGSTNVVDSKSIIDTIRELAREVDLVLIGTDPDTEGEKIGWDIAITIYPYSGKVKRMEFHEVTKRAITQAMKTLRDLDNRLVEAQLVRRIEDRWIGFELSKKLWDAFGQRTLSAGRVQTPLLGWIIERYYEHLKSRRTVFFVTLSNGYVVTLDNIEVKGRKSREVAYELRSQKAVVKRISSEIVTLNPPPPFSTDTMLREAVRVLRIGVDGVMRIAQDLFELGLITYHRTDSTRVSPAGRNIAREYIVDKFSEDMFVPREWMKEGAHECIRPTRPIDSNQLMSMIREGIIRVIRPLTRRHFMLYDLIFRRFMASQMIPGEALHEKYLIQIGEYSKEVKGYTEIVKKGFMVIYQYIDLMPKFEEREYDIINVQTRRIATVPLYTQADLIKLMKERGIGRPSTYAKIIRTLLERRYVIESKRKKLIPTQRGISVYNYLIERYKNLVSENRTRVVEARMKEIEEGRISYQEVLREFFDEIVRYVTTTYAPSKM